MSEEKVVETTSVEPVAVEAAPMEMAAVAEVAAVDKEVKLGDVGSLKLDFSAGVATLQVEAGIPGVKGVEAGVLVKCDAEVLLNQVFAAIEKKLPAGSEPIAEAVKAVIVQAVKSIP